MLLLLIKRIHRLQKVGKNEKNISVNAEPGPGWHSRASDQLSLTLERTVGSWSELGVVETHVLLGERREKAQAAGWHMG